MGKLTFFTIFFVIVKIMLIKCKKREISVILLDTTEIL